MDTELEEKNNDRSDISSLADDGAAAECNRILFKDPVDEQFIKLCFGLDIPSDVRRKALVQLRNLVMGDTPQEHIQVMTCELFPCALYMAMIDYRMPYGPLDPQLQCGYLEDPCLTVSSLLQHTNLNMMTFFQRMRLLRENLLVSDSVQHHLLCLEKSFCIVSGLFYTLERLCRSVFREDLKIDEDSNEENVMPPVPETEGVSFRKKVIWTLFLHTKNQFLIDNQDLNHAVLLLLCCIEFVLRTTPSFLLNSPYDVIRIGCLQTTESRTTNMLLKLAEQVQTSIEEVTVIQQNCTEVFFQGLPHSDGDLDVDGLTEQYKERYRKDGDINELLFLHHDPHLILTDYNKNNTSCEMNGSTSSASPQILTPVRAAMSSVNQLRTILCNASDEPSDQLKEYFKNCANDPSRAISDRIRELHAVFSSNFSESSKSIQTTIADQRFTMAVRLYYRVLESMLNMEQKRLSTSDFSILLYTDSFHQSLLAASIEIVLMTYRLSCDPSNCEIGTEGSQFVFPWILEVFHLQAFEFFKVLESYIKAEPKLTRDIIKHLQWVENRILECIAWKEGSALYASMEASEIVAPSSSEVALHPNTAADMYLSPMHPRSAGISPPVSSPSAQGSISPGQITSRRSQSLSLFLSKVGGVGYQRLQKLCSLMGVTREVQQKIWTCFEYVITNKPGLMRNRHIDQMMMCSLYSICKVVEREVTFKTIVQMYRELPHVEQKVYKNVFIIGQEYDSIIGFYNKVFMQNMKTYILQFSNNNRQTPTLSPVPRQLTSPRKTVQAFTVPGRKRFYVSPLKESPFKLPPSPSQLTPRSSLLFSFGEGFGSAQKLKNITESLTAFRRKSTGSTPKSLKRLRFDQMSSEDDQCIPEKVVKKMSVDLLPTKVPVLDSQQSSVTVEFTA